MSRWSGGEPEYRAAKAEHYLRNLLTMIEAQAIRAASNRRALEARAAKRRTEIAKEAAGHRSAVLTKILQLDDEKLLRTLARLEGHVPRELTKPPFAPSKGKPPWKGDWAYLTPEWMGRLSVDMVERIGPPTREEKEAAWADRQQQQQAALRRAYPWEISAAREAAERKRAATRAQLAEWQLGRQLTVDELSEFDVDLTTLAECPRCRRTGGVIDGDWCPNCGGEVNMVVPNRRVRDWRRAGN